MAFDFTTLYIALGAVVLTLLLIVSIIYLCRNHRNQKSVQRVISPHFHSRLSPRNPYRTQETFLEFREKMAVIGHLVDDICMVCQQPLKDEDIIRENDDRVIHQLCIQHDNSDYD